MPNTLFGRVFIASFLALSFFFGLLGYIINQLSLENVYAAKKEQLRLQSNILLSSAIIGDNAIELPDELREARFDDFESGLYGYISDSQGKIYWSSYSAHTLDLDIVLLESSITEAGKAEYIVYPDYFVYHYKVRWEVKADQPELFTFTVMEDSRPTLANIEDFQQDLRLWLMGIGLVLIALLMLILRWGTKPLRQLARNLKQIESGLKERIEGRYPVELKGVTKNLNTLIKNERSQRERYHSTLADLAHSLKTPLAVIQTELETHQPNPLIAEQTQRMDEIIKHQLQRAVISTQHELSESVLVQTCVDRLVSAMNKVYADKEINFSIDISEGCLFKGDPRDLMEVLGNLLDNACKACLQTIQINASNNDKRLRLEIHDDGAGIAPEQREQLIQRGQRADTQYSGQGIGLNVAHDIIESYQGKLIIEQSPDGGALFALEFYTH
ncbi:ATP-binding protein [Oceanicoccus sagamiensis]|uniref:histidine kinase n=1 Tax=Oceanicoccus sagamiensis TaxID=716816 RepID=A0A1X9NGE2_9GAMM|nr:ATP-binding protein [Oceanicoccus sagamiensis]ARN75462.1 hypothetical protein BST96_15895 [Oceanicoccus sagamiensis]